jgi:arylsulfatase
VLGMLAGTAAPRDSLLACYGEPGTPLFKVMVREGAWKYIFLANGGGEQLFNLENDPDEQLNCARTAEEVVSHLRSRAVAACDIPGARQALDENGLKAFPYMERRRERIYQFDQSRGVAGFPQKPEDVLKGWSRK